MKKTMFITSVIMVVVMAIALTTSSLAWFSATGASTVTTNNLKLEAKANASAGLQIADNSAGPWDTAVSLAPNSTASLANRVIDMYPVLPYLYTTTTGDDEDDFTAAVLNHKFITNNITGNTYVDVDPTKDEAADGYFFTKTIYITNVDKDNAKYVTASCTWYQEDGTTAYTHTSGNALAYVAVLRNAKKVENADRTDVSGDDDWEFLALFCSDTSKTTVNFGGADTAFRDAAVGSSYDILTIANIENANRKTTSTLAKPTVDAKSGSPTYGQTMAYGDVEEYFIVAWYDGINLTNNNSGLKINFTLGFTASNS